MPDGPTTLGVGVGGLFIAASLLEGSFAAFLAGWAILGATLISIRGGPA